MIDPASRRRGTVGGHHVRADHSPDRHAIDAQQRALAVVRLHQRADDIPRTVDFDTARRGADAALELVADHAGAAADIAFGTGPAAPPIERGQCACSVMTGKLSASLSQPS